MSATLLELVGGAIYWWWLLLCFMLLLMLPLFAIYAIMLLLAKLGCRIRRGPPARAHRE